VADVAATHESDASLVYTNGDAGVFVAALA
jgi:hypothetical protein